MKSVLIVSFLILAFGPLAADDLLQNGDFSQGTTYWHGDAKPAGADSSHDLVTSSGTSQGITVDLHPTTWTTVKQVMEGVKRDMTAPNLKLEIAYQVTPDFTLSDHPEDYKGNDPQTGLGTTFGFDKAHIVGRPGQLLVFIDAAPINRNVMENGRTMFMLDTLSMGSFAPKIGDAQTFSATLRLPHLTGEDRPSFCIAIPPGHGTITITKISLVR